MYVARLGTKYHIRYYYDYSLLDAQVISTAGRPYKLLPLACLDGGDIISLCAHSVKQSSCAQLTGKFENLKLFLYCAVLTFKFEKKWQLFTP
jgi:hypothetical protein